ncbi:MAG: hypothetical protein R3C11_00035 [Planctomycetaceae bacterium]
MLILISWATCSDAGQTKTIIHSNTDQHQREIVKSIHQSYRDLTSTHIQYTHTFQEPDYAGLENAKEQRYSFPQDLEKVSGSTIGPISEEIKFSQSDFFMKTSYFFLPESNPKSAQPMAIQKDGYYEVLAWTELESNSGYIYVPQKMR